MKEFVIDASTLMKLYLAEVHSGVATQYVRQAAKLIAPDIIWAESANIVWKRLQRRELKPAEAASIIDKMLYLPIDTHGGFNLVRRAFELAAETSCTAYACMYLALALREGLMVVNGDQRFANSIKSGKYAKHMQFLGD